MEEIKDILQRRAESIGVNQLTSMEIIKKTVLEVTGVEVRVTRLKFGIATLAVDNSAAASEIRLNQAEIITKANKQLADQTIKNIKVIIS